MRFVCINCRAEIDPQFRACPYCAEPVTDFLRRYSVEPVDGKYQLVERLGRGGMGEIFKVVHTHLGATRVIKLMRPNIIADPEAQDRFLREARLATRIHHANVATLHDFSKLPDGTYYMVWEYIEGTTLTNVIRREGKLSPRYAAEISIAALMGLEAIHRAGIVHRDVSPDNIMIARNESGEEEVKIIDLGIAKQEGDLAGHQTRTGLFVGKWKYCSPEHLGLLPQGERIDGRADIYSFGIVMYEMLTGAPPFVSDTPHSYMVKHAQETPRPLRIVNPAIDNAPELEAVIFKALEKDRSQRFQSAREFALELTRILPALPDTDPALDVSTRPTIAVPAERPSTTLPATAVAPGRAPKKAPAAAPSAAPTVVDNEPGVPGRRSSSRSAAIVAILAAILAVGGGLFYFFRNRTAAVSQPPPAMAKAAPVQSSAAGSPQPVPLQATPAVPANETVNVAGEAPPPSTAEPQRPPAAEAAQKTVRKKEIPAIPPPPQETRTPEAVQTVPQEPVRVGGGTVPIPPPPPPAHRSLNPFHHGAKRFVDSEEYKSETAGGLIGDYSLLSTGDSVQWAWVDPDAHLAGHRIQIARFRNASKVRSSAMMSMFQNDLQSALNDATEEGGEPYTAEGLVYWAEDSKSTKRGAGVEVVIRNRQGRTVAMLRHRVYESTPEDAAEEVVGAIADFVEDH